MANAKGDLRSAYILLRCTKKRHDDCRAIRDALLRAHPNVQRAMTTNATVGGQKWCVAGPALVDARKAVQFKREIMRLRAGRGSRIGVERVSLAVDGR